MAKKFRDLRQAMRPEAQARAHEKAIVMKAELPLAELRQARQLSQEQLAEKLSVKQPAVAKMEKRRICIYPPYAMPLKQWVVN